MAVSVKNNTVYAVEEETTEGVYVAPQSANSYVKTLSDGAEMTSSKELLTREISTGSIGKVTPRTGSKSASGSMPVEMCSGDTAAGQAPEYDALMRSAMGLRRQTVATTVDSTDSGGTHTTTRIYLSDADGSVYQVGDTITVQTPGAYHTSPIVAVSSAAGDSYIDLLVAMASAPTDSTVIGATTTYVTAENGHPSLSITKYIESTRREYVRGAKVNSLSLENWSTGQLASFNFGFDAIELKCDLSTNPFTPDYQDCKPPVILSACVFMDGQDLELNDFSFSVENTVSKITATCSPTGQIGSRMTSREVSGSINPYKKSDDCGLFDKFECNTEFSLFASAYNPNCPDDGSYTGTVSVYMPKVIVTEISEADLDGNLQDDISFMAGRGNDGKSEEIYITFS